MRRFIRRARWELGDHIPPMWESLMGRTVCRVFGHAFVVQKISGVLCRRCRLFTHRH